MNNTGPTGILPALLLLVGTACESPGRPYLGEQPPGAHPTLFAPGLVSTDAIELNGVIAPGGKEFYFTRIVDGVFVIYRSHRAGAAWSAPEPLDLYPGGESATAVDMSCTVDGDRLYFLGRCRDENRRDDPRLDLWVSEREGSGWAPARPLTEPVNTESGESYPCVVSDGSLYFSSNRPGGMGGFDIYRAQALPDGSFAEPINVGPPVNSENSEGDTYVAPDESYLIVSSRRPGGLGQGDLFLAFKNESGDWTEPMHLGPEINSEQTDYCPMVTPDGRYLFFSRRVSQPADSGWSGVRAGNVYWVSTAFLQELRP